MIYFYNPHHLELPVMGVTQDKNEKENMALINRLRQRDETALDQLYEKYAAALLHLIQRIISSTELSEEVLQDVFLRIWNKAGQYNEKKGRLFTWMGQIARHTALDALRSGAFQRQAKTDSIESLVNKDDLGEEINVIADAGLRKVVDGMDKDQRLLIDLLYFRQYTQKEAGEALGIPLGTVKTNIRKAIMSLRKILAKESFIILWLSFFNHVAS